MPDMSLDEKQVSDSARSVKGEFPSTMLLPHTRREFAKWLLAALPGAGLLSVVDRLSAAESPMVNKVRSDIAIPPHCRTQALLGFHPVLILCHLGFD
jgi:hypothetical protein